MSTVRFLVVGKLRGYCFLGIVSSVVLGWLFGYFRVVLNIEGFLRFLFEEGDY